MNAALTIALACARFAEFVAAMTALGTALFALYALSPRSAGAAELTAATAAAGQRILTFAGLGSALAALGWATVTFANVTGDFGELVDPAALSAFFFGTDFGGVWLLRLVAAITLAAIVVLLRNQLYKRNPATALVGALAAGLLATQAWIGHPVALGGAMRNYVIAGYVAHVLGAGAWIGGLVPLSWVVSRARTTGSEAVAAAKCALLRFSAAGMIAVAVLLAGGLVNAYSRLGSLADLTGSAWGRLLTCKIILFVILFAAASLNRFVLLPRLSARPQPTLASLVRGIALEQIVGLLVLAAAALLGIQSPPA